MYYRSQPPARRWSAGLRPAARPIPEKPNYFRPIFDPKRGGNQNGYISALFRHQNGGGSRKMRPFRYRFAIVFQNANFNLFGANNLRRSRYKRFILPAQPNGTERIRTLSPGPLTVSFEKVDKSGRLWTKKGEGCPISLSYFCSMAPNRMKSNETE